MDIVLKNFGYEVARITYDGKDFTIHGPLTKTLERYLRLKQTWKEHDEPYEGSAYDGPAFLQRALLAVPSWFGAEAEVVADWDEFVRLVESSVSR